MPRPTTEPVPDKENPDEDGNRESDHGGDGAHGEDGADSHLSAKDQQQEEDADKHIEPHGVDWRVRVEIDLLDPIREGETVVARVGECHSRGGYHAALAHEEAADNGDGQHSQRGVLRHHLDEVGCPWLAQVTVHHGRDVNHGVGDDELQRPSCDTPDAGGHDDCPGRGDIGVAAFFREMERSIVARHGPDDSDEGHQYCDSVWPVRPVLHAPDLARWEELGRGGGPAHRDWDHDNDDEERDHVHGRAVGVEFGDPTRRHARDAGVNDHHDDAEEEDLVVLRHVRRVRDGNRSEGHRAESIVD
ncbi:unnamed protein product [Diplocarpon coronariae]